MAKKSVKKTGPKPKKKPAPAKKKVTADGIVVRCSFQELAHLDDLIPNPRNPNQHPQRQIDLLARIIRRQGWRHPITVSSRSGFIVHGHGRYLAARMLGVESVPVDYQEYETDAQEWEDLLADNKIAELAELDSSLTSQLLKELDELEVDVGSIGFTEKEVQKMLEESEDKAEEPPEVEFSEELMESSNYIVLYFDNDIDWLQALTLFDLKTVKALDSKEGYEKMGIGRVLNGPEALNKILGG